MSQAETESSKPMARQIPCWRMGPDRPYIFTVAPNLPLKEAQAALHHLLVIISGLSDDGAFEGSSDASSIALAILAEIAANLSEACGHD